MEISKIKTLSDNIKNNINKIIIGKNSTIDLILTCILAKGNILLEDTPGTGKTMMAKSLAKSLDINFNRIQFTPDLLPADVIGLSVFNQKEDRFNFVPGPIFTNILLADEINRATPRTQSSLLEAMEEKQVTTDGESRTLDNPFIVIATQNPVETLGTFPLPEAQLDRFMMQLSLGYPSYDEELQILDRFLNNNPIETNNPVCSKKDIIEMQNSISQVYVHSVIKKYIVDLVQATRNASEISLGVSPRGSLTMIKAAQSYAAINGRDFVIPDDIKTLAIPIFAHRIISFNGYNSSENSKIIDKILSEIKVPTEDWRK